MKLARELDESEMHAAFAAITADHELWLAFNQLLAGYIDQATAQVCVPDTSGSSLERAAGGLEWLNYLQAELEKRFEESHVLADKQL